MISLFLNIFNFVALNVHVQPSSQNFDIDISYFCMFWNTCAFVAVLENFGCSSEVVMLLVIFCPFGIPTSMHAAFSSFLSIGASVVRK